MADAPEGGFEDRPHPGFEVWFSELLPRILSVTQRLVGERALAEDIAAEAFARALVRWRVLRNAGYRDAWLTKVATNLALDALRRRPPRPAPTTNDEVVRSEELVDLRLALVAALDRLPRRQRETVVLRYLGQFSEREVAATLKVSPGTVKTHLRRGLAALRSDPSFTNLETLDVLAAD